MPGEGSSGSSTSEALAHLLDDRQLIVEPVLELRVGVLAIPPDESLFGNLAEVLDVGLARRRREDGKVPRFEVEIDRAAVGDLLAAGDGIRDVRTMARARALS